MSSPGLSPYAPHRTTKNGAWYLLLLKSLARRIIASNLCRSLSVVKFRIFLSRSARENGAIRQGACEADRSNANLYSSGIVSAAPIGVNVPMTNPRATAAANQVTRVGLRSAAQKAVIALIKIRAFVSAAISQNNGNVVNHGAKFSLLPCRSKRYSALFPVRSSKQLGTKTRRKFRQLPSPQVEAQRNLIIKIPAQINTSKPLCYRRVCDDDHSCTKAHLPYNSSTQLKYPQLLTITRWQFSEPISFLRPHRLGL